MMDVLDARAKLAAALAPLDPADPTVLVDLVDSLEPPALMLGWADPAIDPEGRFSANCVSTGTLLITAVAGRLEPGAGVAKIEQLWDYTNRRLSAGGWARARWTAPRWFVIGNVNYLASRGTIVLPIQGGP